MKKLCLLLLFAMVLTTLSGCTVNWFGAQYDVPWYYVAVPVAIIFVIAHIVIMSGTYVCPDCNTEFKPKWYHFFTYIHHGSKRVAKCPNCNRKGLCKRKKS